MPQQILIDTDILIDVSRSIAQAIDRLNQTSNSSIDFCIFNDKRQ